METDIGVDRKLMEVNFFGPVTLTKGRSVLVQNTKTSVWGRLKENWAPRVHTPQPSCHTCYHRRKVTL